MLCLADDLRDFFVVIAVLVIKQDKSVPQVDVVDILSLDVGDDLFIK